MSGMFIALEGGEGAGKSSTAKLLREALIEAGIEPDMIVLTREPGGSPMAEVIRNLVLTPPNGATIPPMAELALFAAARVCHLEETINPALAAGKLCISDRFVGSTVAYQGAGRGLGEGAVLWMHELTANAVQPDLTVFLQIDPREGLARSLKRLAADGEAVPVFEQEGLKFHYLVSGSFLDQAAALSPAQKLVISGTLPQQEIVKAIADRILEKFRPTENISFG